jgi:hypothetical protein
MPIAASPAELFKLSPAPPAASAKDALGLHQQRRQARHRRREGAHHDADGGGHERADTYTGAKQTQFVSSHELFRALKALLSVYALEQKHGDAQRVVAHLHHAQVRDRDC